jgi:hypothetical protein
VHVDRNKLDAEADVVVDETVEMPPMPDKKKPLKKGL